MSCNIHRVDPDKYRQHFYCIEGNPVALARPRLGRHGVYDSQTHLKMQAVQYIENQHADMPKFKGPLHLEITFHVMTPTRFSVKKKAEMEGKFHLSRPDFSNLLKFAEDIAQGIVYDDDCIIVCVCGSKVYSNNPRTEMTITELRE